MNMPSSDDALLERLRESVREFGQDFGRADRVKWAEFYLEGLLLGKERRNAEALARRASRWGGKRGTDPAQALQHFLNQSPWDEQKPLRRYRVRMAARFPDESGTIVVGDTVFHKRGGNSVGVHRQLDPATGKKTNCQIGVTLHRIGRKADFPLALRLYLPRRWLDNVGRLDAALVPEQYRSPANKVDVALELLDVVNREGLAVPTIVADGLYGTSSALRDGLAKRRLTFLVEAHASLIVQAPSRDSAIPGVRSRQPATADVTTLSEFAVRHAHQWDWQAAAGTSSCFAWSRVLLAPEEVSAANYTDLGLLVERRSDRALSFALSNLPASMPATEVIRLWQMRERREHILTQLQALGLDHFEGRSWRGFHHHVCLVMLAYGFWLTTRPKA
jgi:SRSO17 transposase